MEEPQVKIDLVLVSIWNLRIEISSLHVLLNPFNLFFRSHILPVFRNLHSPSQTLHYTIVLVMGFGDQAKSNSFFPSREAPFCNLNLKFRIR